MLVRKKTAFLLLALLFTSLCSPAMSQSLQKRATDRFVIFYAEKDSSHARQTQSTLEKFFNEISFDLQVTVDDTIRVYIIPNRSMFRKIIKGYLPKWTGAFASPAENAMYLKSPSWDHEGNFHTTLVHELLHLLVHAKMQTAKIPRWMNEGLAIFYSQDTRWITSTALSKAFATRSVIALSDIDRVLNFHRAKAELAYQESYSAVQYLLATYDIDALQIILDNIRERKSLDEAFLQATGSTFDHYEKEWLQYAQQKYKWVWLNDLDNYIWVLIIFLFLLALIMVRIRNRRKIKEWAQEAKTASTTDETEADTTSWPEME